MRRNKKEDALLEQERIAGHADTKICPLCDRPLGINREKHHIIPKARGGRETVLIHPICHRKIHKVFSNKELEHLGTLTALKDHEDIHIFIKWLRGKDPDFYKQSR